MATLMQQPAPVEGATTAEGGVGEAAAPTPVPVGEKEESLEDLVSLLFTQLRSTPEEKWVQDASSIDDGVLEAFANAKVGSTDDGKGSNDGKEGERPTASPAEGGGSPPKDS